MVFQFLIILPRRIARIPPAQNALYNCRINAFLNKQLIALDQTNIKIVLESFRTRAGVEGMTR